MHACLGLIKRVPIIRTGGPVEEAQALLDDHIVKAGAMAASPFSKPLAQRLLPWEAKLRRFQV